MHFSRTHPRLSALAAVGLAAAAGVALWLTASGFAQGGGGEAVILGKTASTPKPVCPTPNVPDDQAPPADKVCQVMGRVTGFQMSADGRRNPYKVRQPGRIVAWSVSLGRPDKTEQEYFETELSKSGPPSARLSILKAKSDGRYKLTKQTPTVQIKPWFGEEPIFTLSKPLRVKKGVIVAITTPTWLPNLGLRGASTSDTWRASRLSGECEGDTNLLERSRPQQKVGGNRLYECEYKATRLIYRAFLEPRR
jgi:hypothetical protein